MEQAGGFAGAVFRVCSVFVIFHFCSSFLNLQHVSVVACVFDLASFLNLQHICQNVNALIDCSVFAPVSHRTKLLLLTPQLLFNL